MIKVILISVCCCLISACIDESDATQSSDLPYSIASIDVQTGINSQQIHVVRNSTEYSSLMSTVQLMGQTPNPDFNESMLVGIFSTLNSCYSNSVDTVKDVDGSILITVNIASENANTCNPVVGNNHIIIDTAQSPKQVSVVFKKI